MSSDDIEAFMAASDAAQPGDVVDIAGVACHPSRPVVAATLDVAVTRVSDAVQHVAVIDLDGDVRRLDLGYTSTRGACWSPDGEQLAVIATGHDGGAEVAIVDPALGRVMATWQTEGLPEQVAWNPDGRSIAVLVAGVGAEVSDVYGSGVVGGPSQSWQPMVSPGAAGRRTLMTWAPGGEALVVSDVNVWEFAWSGGDHLVAIATDGPGEGDWYRSRLVRLSLDGSSTDLHRPDRQISCPRSSPDGRHWSVIEGLASDRGMLAGSVVVGSVTGTGGRRTDVPDVHVTDHRWTGDTSVVAIGVSGLGTAVAELSIADGGVDLVWSGPEAVGRYIPQVSSGPASGVVVVLEDHATPPRLATLAPDGPQSFMNSASAGMAHAASVAGTVERCAWEAPDGWLVEGYLALPADAGLHPLVLTVHGGPVGAWRDVWCGRDPHTAALVASGHAVLRPNPRGSLGRGEEFAEAVLGDMGGLDVLDLLEGVRHVGERSDVDKTRIGITGNSYGGFMAAWMPVLSDVFGASVSRSPVTDWLTQHLTSNIGAFDALFLDGDVFDPESQYHHRSPLRQHKSIRTPMLLTAGALDLATPPSQAQVMHRALLEDGIETSLVIYPEEGHGVRQREALVDQCRRMVAWFEQHLVTGR